MFRKAAAAIGLALVVAACGSGMETGIVVDKEHHESYTYLQPVPTGQTIVLVEQTTPECWELSLQNGDGFEEVCVSQVMWERIAVGDHYGKTWDR